MKTPAAEAIAAGYDQAPESASAAYAQSLWRSSEPCDLIPALVAAFPHIRRAWGRARILLSLIPYARVSPNAVGLAMRALTDRSYTVRHEACAVLAYSLDPAAIPALQAAAVASSERSSADMQAAVQAIIDRNHHLYVDRAGDGHTLWQVPHVAGL